MKAIEIGSVIKSLLLSKQEVTDKIKKEIHPIVAPPGTGYPFVTYCRTSVSPTYTKDKRSLEDTATVDVTIHAASYESSVEILRLAFDALQGYSGECNGVEVDEIRMVDSSEDFQEDSYLQNMTFEIDITNK
jgi:hypothetical protein